MNNPDVLERLKHLHPKIIDLSLERVERLLERLGRPQDRLAPVVHVAGTNGKGSLIACLRACLKAAGNKVHVYTSPHLVRFNERILVAGEEIDDNTLQGLLEECEEVNGGGPITFFEITTAAALLAFTRRPADIVLLETGLGGRLDATNVVNRPALCAITPISADHQQFLGAALAEIAGEKAGILKRGVPCIVAAQDPEAMEIIDKRADEVGAPLYTENREWRVRREDDAMIYEEDGMIRRLPPPGLIGAHQVQNAGMAVACLRRLSRFYVPNDAVAEGLTEAIWPGRLQRLNRGALVEMLPPGWELWLDGAHNPSAAAALAVQARSWSDKPLHLVMGMTTGRDPEAFLTPLAKLIKTLRAVAIPGEESSLRAEEISRCGLDLNIDAKPVADVAEAIRDIVNSFPAPARVLVCGSLYLVGATLTCNDK